MGLGHVPEDALRPPGEGADVQGRQRRGTAAGRALNASAARGRFGEAEAARWYEHRGGVVVDRNWRCPSGEIDLVVMLGATVVFCEVKARASTAFGGPQGAVGYRKQQRLRRLAVVWLAEHRPGAAALRFDVAAVVNGKVEVIEAAF